MYRCRWVNMQEWQLFKKNKTPKQWQIKVYTRVGQYPGITTHLVEIYDLTLCHVKEVGQHVGMMGQHKQEWWVNMVRNLQFSNYPYLYSRIFSRIFKLKVL